ncbi:hypothetical protein [Pseudonocardia asaccharolytica]|uniref:Uncharacterized protein n=1 Tax=Pseudonocardia asaccharolytica DSM 44247 = NBRC 16224 TaxID=1123024 RepID=A0A511D3J9_9PSEU|nr:hypothetical protein [Pseudonocardia asaccharolytica]GEL19345.1 hypothetical protein PA7_31820 [Pseudonocardia asaccharolytica DSM 44247 = NBRC 16224]
MGLWRKVGDGVRWAWDRQLETIKQNVDQAKASARAEADAGFAERAGYGCAGVVLDGDEVVWNGERRPVAGVSAVVDTAGNINRRVTATRLVAVGVFALALKKKQDDREVFLLVDGPEFQWVVDVPPAKLAAARSFAARLTTAGRRAAG